MAPPSRIVLEGSLGERRAVVDIAPGRAGGNTVRVSIKDAQGRPADLDEVSLSLALPEARIEPIQRALRRLEPGEFVYQGSDFALPGRWTLRVQALVSDFERASLTFEVPIAEAR